MAGKNSIFKLWAGALVLVLVLSLGYAIRRIQLANRPVEPEPTPKVEIAGPEQADPPAQEPAPQVREAPRQSVLDETPEAKEANVDPQTRPGEEAAPAPEPVAAEPQQPQWRPGQNGEMIRQFFEELDLTEAEQQRLRAQFMARVQEFQGLSPEERQAEMDRMRRMGEEWQQMNDVQRRAVVDRMKERYEDWRRDPSMDLPELTLDLD